LVFHERLTHSLSRFQLDNRIALPWCQPDLHDVLKANQSFSAPVWAFSAVSTTAPVWEFPATVRCSYPPGFLPGSSGSGTNASIHPGSSVTNSSSFRPFIDHLWFTKTAGLSSFRSSPRNVYERCIHLLFGIVTNLLGFICLIVVL
jgi:hypothetical protein